MTEHIDRPNPFGGIFPEGDYQRLRVANDSWWAEFDVLAILKPQTERSLLIVPGAHSGITTVAHIIRTFCLHGFSVVCFAQPDYVTSTRSRNFHDVETFERYAILARSVLDAFNIPRAIVYGSSTGGGAAITLAAEHPDRIISVVCVNPAGLFKQHCLRIVPMYGMAAFQEAAHQLRSEQFPSLRDAFRWVRWALFRHAGSPLKPAMSDSALSFLARMRQLGIFYLGAKDRLFPAQKVIGAITRASPKHVVVHVDPAFAHADPQTAAKAERVVCFVEPILCGAHDLGDGINLL